MEETRNMIENCKLMLEHYRKCMNDPSLTEQARLNAKVAFADMKANLKNRGVTVDAPSSPGKK